jgi:hypothetical protein
MDDSNQTRLRRGEKKADDGLAVHNLVNKLKERRSRFSLSKI